MRDDGIKRRERKVAPVAKKTKRAKRFLVEYKKKFYANDVERFIWGEWVNGKWREWTRHSRYGTKTAAEAAVKALNRPGSMWEYRVAKGER